MTEQRRVEMSRTEFDLENLGPCNLIGRREFWRAEIHRTSVGKQVPPVLQRVFCLQFLWFGRCQWIPQKKLRC